MTNGQKRDALVDAKLRIVDAARAAGLVKGDEGGCVLADEVRRLRAKLERVEALLVTTAVGRRKPESVHEHAEIPARSLRWALRD